MDKGQLVEFDEPHVLLQNPRGLLSSYVQQTGAANAKKLADIAQAAHDKRSISQNVDTEDDLPSFAGKVT